jgi:hypothetical protein
MKVADFAPRWARMIADLGFIVTGVVFLYVAFLKHYLLYVPSIYALGVLVVAIWGATLFIWGIEDLKP